MENKCEFTNASWRNSTSNFPSTFQLLIALSSFIAVILQILFLIVYFWRSCPIVPHFGSEDVPHSYNNYFADLTEDEIDFTEDNTSDEDGTSRLRGAGDA